MKTFTCFLLSVLVLGASTADAEITLSIGDTTFRPDALSPIIEIPLVATSDNFSSDQVTGFNLRAQIGDGIGGASEPVFSAIVFSETIWDIFPNTAFGGPIEGFEQFAQASVLFNASGDQVAAQGVVARLFVDTSGFLDGSFPVMLFATQIGEDSDFIGQGSVSLQPTIINGTITAIPEPSAFVLTCVGTLSVMTYRRTSPRQRRVVNGDPFSGVLIDG